MFLNGLDQLGADGQHRIERGHRVLEHHRERAAAQLAQFLRRQLQQILPVEHHAAGQLGLLWQKLQDRPRQHGLAATGLADDTERLSGADREIDMIDCPQIAARGRQVDSHILDREQYATHSTPCLGSVSARMVSPIRLNESTVRNIAIAGMKASRGATSRLSRPSPIMLPQLEIGGGTPRPRNESAPSTTMVTATPSRKNASSGNSTFGSSSRSRMRACEAPSACAAITNSRRASVNVDARATRMKAGTPSTPRMQVRLKIDWPRKAVTASAKISGGNASSTSMLPTTRDSKRPRK